MNEISLGQIVHSKAGRDKDKYFIIVDIIDKNYVLIADGKLRSINNPKKKKLKHLQFHDKIDKNVNSKLINHIKVEDAEIRKLLSLMDY